MKLMHRGLTTVVAIFCAIASPAVAETRWSVAHTEFDLTIDSVACGELQLEVSRISSTGNARPVDAGTEAFDASRTREWTAASVMAVPHPVGGLFRLEGGIRLAVSDRRVEIIDPAVNLADLESGRMLLGVMPLAVELLNARVAWDSAAQEWRLRAPEVVITGELAKALDRPTLSGARIGQLDATVVLAPAGGDDTIDGVNEPTHIVYDLEGEPRGGPSWACNGNVGPDVIVGELVGDSGNSAYQVTAVNIGGNVYVDAFAVGTTSCNIGTQPLSWLDNGASGNETRHPVIGQNFFRLSNGRFEHIGQSWLKHGFFALQGTACCTSCSPQNGEVALGVGCSDPYSASRNGGQSGAGPKYQVNPTTGVHQHPIANPSYSGTIARRLQVYLSDLEDPNALYFVEGQYVTADDAAAGNNNNNASYRRVLISGTGNDRTFVLTGATQRAQAGIRAWRDNDPAVVEADVQVPNDGLYIIAAKATDLGDGYYRYEYAVQNLNSERGADSFSIPVTIGGTVRNVGFHDVPYHSGDGIGNVNRDGTDWVPSYAGNTMTWTMVNVGANSNALRWGTLYNFRFETNVQPANVNAVISLFAEGTPAIATASIVGPGGDRILIDCNNNGLDDYLDITELRSSDCNADGIPDECAEICNLKATLVATATSPSFACAPPGDTTRLFITQLNGVIQILDLTSGALLPTPFLNISSLVRTGGEDGLFSMAFHPNYSANGKFYVNYTTLANPRRTRIVEYTVSANPNIANAASAVILREITQPFSNHNGGQLQFGPDGRLYCATGDGGSQGDPNNLAQSDASLLGKMLRLDVDNPPTYVPSDNPGGAWLPEVWAKGLRNPWRFSFDRLTGDLYIADVGQSVWEEVNFQPASSIGGENYGWRCYEGNAVYNSSGCGPAANYKFPIHVVNHSDSGTISITGGYVYRGCAIPGLSGTYFFADYGGNYIRTFRYDGSTLSQLQDRTADITPDAGSISAIVSFGEDAAGELYIVCVTGFIYRIECDIPVIGDCGNGSVEDGEQCDPPDSLNCDCSCQIIPDCDPVFEDQFEADQGWTVSGNATDGHWNRGVPVNCSSRGAPPAAFGGAGQCYLTDNSMLSNGGVNNCDSDVDGGSTILTSPVFDLSSGGQIRYAYWLNDTPGGLLGPGDGLTVEVSTNGGTNWTLVRTYAAAAASWREDTILVGGAAGQVAAGSNIRIRFIATDAGTGHVVEAGVDAFVACASAGPPDCNGNCIDDADDIAGHTSFDCNANGIPDECEPGVPGCDCNGNGVNDAIDIANETSADCNQNGVPDECDIASNPQLDCDGGPLGDASQGGALFSTTCIFCHNVNGTGGIGDPFPCGGPCPGPSLRNKSRVQIWNKLLPPTNHPGGSHPEFTQQDFANLEAFLADAGSRGRPDRVPDSCQTLADCDLDGASDGCELEAGTQVDLDYDSIPDGCDQPCGAADGDMNGDSSVNGADVQAFVNGLLGSPSQAEICAGDFSQNAALDLNDIAGMVNALLNAP
ncbi:MAG: PQQ-dependent sugar dehydrogenase [Phycisphaerae bacterium]|nr:PQQ-dependent sugar dehydrogenase [Phycisphaerae bacterium]